MRNACILSLSAFSAIMAKTDLTADEPGIITEPKLKNPEKKNARNKALKSEFKPIISTTHRAEGQTFEIQCPRHDSERITYLNYIKENTLEESQNSKSLVQIWGGQFIILDNAYKGRLNHEIKSLGTVINLSDLTLADKGYYYCRLDQMGLETTVSDLSELIMWATPTNPHIAMDPFFFSNDVKTNKTSVDYTQPQNVAQCESNEGHPSPILAFFDVTTGARLTEDSDVECFPNPSRKKVKNCRLILKFIVTKEHDKKQYRCEMTHPSLDNGNRRVEAVATLNVHYPPHSLQMSGNRTEKTISCKAVANPEPTYYYKVGRAGSFVKIGPVIQIQ